MSIANDLKRLSAPRKVVEAGVALDEAIQARLSPSGALAAYVREWVTRNQACNKYGR
jgi:hypothetical protein